MAKPTVNPMPLPPEMPKATHPSPEVKQEVPLTVHAPLADAAVTEGKPAEVKTLPDAEPKVDAKTEVKSAPIKVQAMRPGTYKRGRKKVGDIFYVDKESQLGSWMKKF